MFELQEKLYAVGARNFLFPDLPPVNRSPACTFTLTEDVAYMMRSMLYN